MGVNATIAEVAKIVSALSLDRFARDPNLPWDYIDSDEFNL